MSNKNKTFTGTHQLSNEDNNNNYNFNFTPDQTKFKSFILPTSPLNSYDLNSYPCNNNENSSGFPINTTPILKNLISSDKKKYFLQNSNENETRIYLDKQNHSGTQNKIQSKTNSTGCFKDLYEMSINH